MIGICHNPVSRRNLSHKVLYCSGDVDFHRRFKQPRLVTDQFLYSLRRPAEIFFKSVGKHNYIAIVPPGIVFKNRQQVEKLFGNCVAEQAFTLVFSLAFELILEFGRHQQCRVNHFLCLEPEILHQSDTLLLTHTYCLEPCESPAVLLKILRHQFRHSYACGI